MRTSKQTYHTTWGLKKTATSSDGLTTEYEYDNFRRITGVTEVIDGESFTKSYQYNTNNQVIQQVYPSGFVLNKHYDSNGYLASITDNSGQNPIFTNNSMNAFGQYTEYTLGNDNTTSRTYDKIGSPLAYSSWPIHAVGMEFDEQNSNLKYRYDMMHLNKEILEYDDLNRLTGSVAGPVTTTGNIHWPSEQPVPESVLELSYAPNGNILFKNDAGSYTYDTQKHNAVVEVNTGQESEGMTFLSQNITYTSFQKAEKISHVLTELNISYGADEQRRKSVLTVAGQEQKSIIYQGDYERITVEEDVYEVHYISCGAGLVAMNVRENGGEDQLHYVYTDHLGSINTITDENGDIVYEQNFDAWGRRRNPEDWSYPESSLDDSPEWLIRGYTGHEHIAAFEGVKGGLINMNGRLYDSEIGRMLSPDNFVQSPLFSQSYNRYSYAWNNPLKYTDPDGEVVVESIIIGAVVGGYLGGSVANNTYNPFDWDWSSGSTYAGIAFGAGVGALGGYKIGGAIKKGAINQKIMGSSLYSGSLNTAYNYEYGQHVGSTLGNFASGFIGSYFGLSANSIFSGMLIGGALTANVGVWSGEVNSSIEFLQKAVGGGLSVFSGSSFYGTWSGKGVSQYIKFKGQYLFGKSTIGKMANKGMVYGLQNMAADFAYSDFQKYRKRSLRQHASVFGAGFLNGILQWESGQQLNFKDEFVESLGAFSISRIGYYSEYYLTTRALGYNPFEYENEAKKQSIGTKKSFFFNLISRNL